MGHDAKWTKLPNLRTGNVGQYHCSKCRLTLLIGYNRHYEPKLTGWHWKIEDSAGQRIDSAGSKHISKYEQDVEALAEVQEAGLRRFESVGNPIEQGNFVSDPWPCAMPLLQFCAWKSINW